MSLLNNNTVINVIEWAGVASSLTGSILNANGRRSSFAFWTVSAILLAIVAIYLGRTGWLALQGSGIAINFYGMNNWQGNAPTRAFALVD